ncbi:hypothetical protein HYALB_00012931 [Hymenoscyphus albidus]|uniref:Uncharacterized protein n=1 Tax=Hymenoscyphus albidus TaxID=595503 RepID=A0A9N9LVQ2_9HELO|nr:hypothetical protein HYALB_00012931 [Hymenoscyphus albidus]
MSSPTDNFQVGNSGNNESGGSIPSPDSQPESQPETKPKVKRGVKGPIDMTKTKRTSKYRREYDPVKHGPIIVNGHVPGKTTDAHFELFPMPIVNDIELKQGKKLTLNHKYSSASWLVSTRGAVQEVQCDHCEDGPYTKCIVVPGVLNNSCSNCLYNAQLTKCSHRTDRKRSQNELEVRDGGGQDQQPTETLNAPRKKPRRSMSFAEKNAPKLITFTREEMGAMTREVFNMSREQLIQHHHTMDLKSFVVARYLAVVQWREADSWLDEHLQK